MVPLALRSNTPLVVAQAAASKPRVSQLRRASHPLSRRAVVECRLGYSFAAGWDRPRQELLSYLFSGTRAQSSGDGVTSSDNGAVSEPASSSFADGWRTAPSFSSPWTSPALEEAAEPAVEAPAVEEEKGTSSEAQLLQTEALRDAALVELDAQTVATVALEVEVQRLQAQLEEASPPGTAEKLAAREVELSEAQAALRAKESRLQEILARTRALEEELWRLPTEEDILQMQRESSEQILAANARSATLAGKVSKLEKELVDMQATSAQEKSWLETQLENANELAAKLEASITEKAKTISELTAKLPEVVKELADQRAENMKLQATIDVKTRQVSELTKKLAQQVFKVEQMELGAIGTKASDARVDELTAKVRELEEQLASPTREEAKADIAAANDQMAKDMLELQARNAELQAKVAKLEVQATSKPAKVTQSTGGDGWSGKLLARIRELEESLAYSVPQREVQELLEQANQPFLEAQAENATLKAQAKSYTLKTGGISREGLLEASIAQKDRALADMTSKLMQKVKEMEELQFKMDERR
mmetsp:Transcript_1450/g.5000  ORF Transcript_1450/g.5000 Transcript_1450/m.5000 type:complete len:540 (+) Transcript_1450:101-1720(+)